MRWRATKPPTSSGHTVPFEDDRGAIGHAALGAQRLQPQRRLLEEGQVEQRLAAIPVDVQRALAAARECVRDQRDQRVDIAVGAVERRAAAVLVAVVAAEVAVHRGGDRHDDRRLGPRPVEPLSDDGELVGVRRDQHPAPDELEKQCRRQIFLADRDARLGERLGQRTRAAEPDRAAVQGVEHHRGLHRGHREVVAGRHEPAPLARGSICRRHGITTRSARSGRARGRCWSRRIAGRRPGLLR